MDSIEQPSSARALGNLGFLAPSVYFEKPEQSYLDSADSNCKAARHRGRLLKNNAKERARQF